VAKVCTWEDNGEDAWETSCGEAFVLNEDGPTENGMKYCCYCGKPLREMLICDGACNAKGICVGLVRPVIVSASHWEPQKFHYCEAAIVKDRQAGFKVEVLDVPDQTRKEVKGR